jgi:hypothetical protein
VEGVQRFGFELFFDFKMWAGDISMGVVNETLAGRPESESLTSNRSCTSLLHPVQKFGIRRNCRRNFLISPWPLWDLP